MSYNPNVHHRRSIRLQTYDYTQNGAYFITICTHERAELFGEIIDGEMWLSQFGNVVEDCWRAAPEHFPFVELDAWVVMPNHFHGILVILEHHVGARHALPLPREFGKPPAESLHSITGSFKSAVARRINLMRNTPTARIWQRNYYEHIVRGLDDLDRLRTYIYANPGKWFEDRYYRA